jgi:hypothetical protein
LNKPLFLTALIFLFTAMALGAAEKNPNEQTSGVGLPDYPRIEHFENGSVRVDFPTLDSWPDFRYLKAWIPVEVSLKGAANPLPGSVFVQAATDIDFERRTVDITDLKILDSRFSIPDGSQPLQQLLEQAFEGRERTVALDVLLRLLPDDFDIPDMGTKNLQLNFEPPAIVVSETPLRLLSIDKEPVRAPIEGTGLEYVVNTDWDVFYHPGLARWYVLNEGVFQQNNYLSSGDWIMVEELPADFRKLAQDDNWKDVQTALSVRIPRNPPTPFVISLESTELILLDGSARTEAIAETGIQYVTNTQSDLFKYQGRWYFLVSGRWFVATELTGTWRAVKDLPTVFAQIDGNHAKAHVLYSVPGTRQAKLAMIEAALPHRVSVAMGSAAQLDVTWIGEPRFEPIETTRLHRGVNTPFQIIMHNNFYYLCFEGAWYFSATPGGPWKAALQIPDEIYRIPPSDPAFNVTFVRLDQNQETSDGYVDYHYSSGYTGSFSTSVSVVYGTGWYYPSSVYWDPWRRPYYWRYGSPYGHNIGYHPVGAYYGGRAGYHYPWGGWYGSTSATFSSPKVEFNHDYGSAWEGPLQTTPGNPAEAASKSLDEFLPKKKIDGSEEFIKTSKEGVAMPAKVSASTLYSSVALAPNLFSGPDGEVYKHENQEWSQYGEGNWIKIQSPGADTQPSSQLRQNREAQSNERWLPAHKRTLSRSELDRQKMARLEGMDNYSKYRMEKSASGGAN